MASSISDIRASVRSITEYGTDIISDADLDELIGEAEDEIKSEAGRLDLQFYSGDPTFEQDRALVWLTVLFVKIRVGEIEGITMSVGDLRMTSLRAPNSFYMSQFMRKLHSIGDLTGFGSTNVSRSERTYGYE